MPGINGSILHILTEFLTNKRKRIPVDGYLSSFTSVESGVPQRSVFGPLFILFTADMWSGISCRMISFADDASLLASISRSNLRYSFTES